MSQVVHFGMRYPLNPHPGLLEGSLLHLKLSPKIYQWVMSYTHSFTPLSHHGRHKYYRLHQNSRMKKCFYLISDWESQQAQVF